MRVRNGHWIALTLLLVLAAAFLYRETRGTTLWFDEWSGRSAVAAAGSTRC